MKDIERIITTYRNREAKDKFSYVASLKELKRMTTTSTSHAM
jgi:hypothetical protein